MLVHPLFPHVHGAGHEDAPAAFALADGVAADHLSLDQQPGLRAQPIEGGFRAGVGGILMPLLLAGLLLDARRLRHTLMAVPHQHWYRPPAPPPRFPAPIRAFG